MLHNPDGDAWLWLNAKRLFGFWKTAIEVSGREYSRVTLQTPNPWGTKRGVITEIRRRHRRGLPLTASGVRLGELPGQEADGGGTHALRSMEEGTRRRSTWSPGNYSEVQAKEGMALKPSSAQNGGSLF